MSQPADEGGAPTFGTELASRIKIAVRPMAPYLLLDSDTSILLCLVVCAFGT